MENNDPNSASKAKKNTRTLVLPCVSLEHSKLLSPRLSRTNIFCDSHGIKALIQRLMQIA